MGSGSSSSLATVRTLSTLITEAELVRDRPSYPLAPADLGRLRSSIQRIDERVVELHEDLPSRHSPERTPGTLPAIFGVT